MVSHEFKNLKNELPRDANMGVEPNLCWSWLVPKLLPSLTEMTLKNDLWPRKKGKTHKWPHSWIACTRKHGISGILQGSSGNRSCNLAFISSGGSHIGFCANRPPEVKLNLLQWFLKTLCPYLTPCQIAETSRQVHDCTRYAVFPLC